MNDRSAVKRLRKTSGSITAQWPLMSMRTAGIAILAGFCTAVLLAYTTEQDGVNNTPVPTRWPNAQVSWSVNPTIGSNINTTGGKDVVSVLQSAFGAWGPENAQLNGQVINNLSIGGATTSQLSDPDSGDCVNVISFNPSSAVRFPTGAIAFTQVATSFGPPPTVYPCSTPPTMRTCPLPSCLIDADIVFNPKEPFSTTTPPIATDFDLQSVATHEVGHLLGMDHSGIASAVMYPFGDSGQSESRTPSVDDVVGMGFLYPSSRFGSVTGTLAGQITQGGAGIFGAHVVAIDSATGSVVVDGLTDLMGKYSISGVPPGSYQVLVLPLQGIYTLQDFGGWVCGFAEHSPPCCDPSQPGCTGKGPSNPTNYTGVFH